MLQGIPEDEAHVMKLRNWWLETLVDKWLDFYFQKQGAFSDKLEYRRFMIEQINFYADYLQWSINRVKTFTVEPFDAASFEKTLEIEADFQELIFDGRTIPQVAINYRKNKEEREKQWVESHKIVSRMKKWWSEFFKDVK